MVNFIYCTSPFENKPLKTFFKPWAKNLGLAGRARKELIILFWPIFGIFWSPVILVTITKKNPKNIKKFQKIPKSEKRQTNQKKKKKNPKKTPKIQKKINKSIKKKQKKIQKLSKWSKNPKI